MGGLTRLLGRAGAAGLTVRAEGDRIVIKGPRQAESIARELLGHKAEILALLAGAACDPAPERTAEPIPTPEPGCPAGPASALYRLIQHSKPADRPVMTPLGPGQLWQVFSERVGVILDAAPERVTFFDDPALITELRGRPRDAPGTGEIIRDLGAVPAAEAGA